MPIFLLIPFLFVIIIFLPLKFRIKYFHQNNEDEFEFTILLFNKITAVKIKIPFFKQKSTPPMTKIRAEIYSFLLKLKPGKNKIIIKKEIKINKENIQKFDELMKHNLKKITIHDFKLVFSTLNLKCNYFYWKTNFGFNNPAFTGFSNGIIWNLKYIFGYYLKKICRVENINFEVYPNFNEKLLNINLKGIFSLYFGNIILTVIKLFLYHLKINKQ